MHKELIILEQEADEEFKASERTYSEAKAEGITVLETIFENVPELISHSLGCLLVTSKYELFKTMYPKVPKQDTLNPDYEIIYKKMVEDPDFKLTETMKRCITLGARIEF